MVQAMPVWVRALDLWAKSILERGFYFYQFTLMQCVIELYFIHFERVITEWFFCWKITNIELSTLLKKLIF
jgi:hypothetical protein